MFCRTATLAALLLPALITNANAATPVVCPPQWGPAKVLVQQDAVAAPAGWTGTGVMANSGLITQKLTLVVWNRAVTGNGNLQCQYGGLINPQQPSSRYGTFLFSRAIPATCQPGPAWRAGPTVTDATKKVIGQQYICGNPGDPNALVDPAACAITCP